jgi:hypothetical protein
VQRIKVNELGKANGELDVWINQQAVLSRKDIRFRGQKQALIDTFYFSTFHGGNTAKWGPKNDSYALFDNIVVSRGALVAN